MAGRPGDDRAGSTLRGVPAFDRSRHLFGAVTAATTLVLIFVGGLVTSTGSGLSVPDWPLSYGMLMPPMVGGVFYEHSHRIVASLVGALTLALALWTARAEPRPGVRRLAWAALAAVVAQGVLGGLTVIFLLPTAVSVAHACLAQTFFCLVIALAYATSREWRDARAPDVDQTGLRGAALTATLIVYGQLLVGAVMRHIGAGLAIPDFPLASGRVLPPVATTPVLVHFAHRIGALLVLLAVACFLARARRAGDPRFTRLGAALLGLVGFQIALGAATVLTGKAVTPTTLHVATGAAILGGCWLSTLRAFRLRRPAPAALAVPVARPVTQS
ncbi:MAG: cytochrome oxidase biogenesis protein CtaA [Acidobacteria bacterium]|nr:MAG: cytochrome oxidase biogenesis protein CtaA [Acidobacteriota bacterium]PYQ19984.1 MAG: cytochrome oxidase biogenesis protein CtaA [Acidobacteriota bacterium]